MDRRAFLKMAAAGTSTLALPDCGGLPPRPSPPNVVFVFADQLRADVCGPYGGRDITTPHLDRLAAEGVVFSNAVASCPLCTPYRGMLQTGRYPTHSGVLTNFVEASHAQNPHCLADVFSAAGYETAFIGKWHLAAGLHREDGLLEQKAGAVAAYQSEDPETEFVAPGPGRLGYRHWQAFNIHMDYNNYWFYEDEPQKRFSGRYETDTQIDQTIAHMEKCRRTGRPFFLCVAPHPPHPPFSADLVPAGYLDPVTATPSRPPNLPSPDVRNDQEVRCYLAMTKNLDDNLGRLLAYLDATGLDENTIVVFTSDHGEMFGSHGRTNKMVAYAESINVPLVIRWPLRIQAGARLDALQTPIDHLPTLCGLAGLGIPHEVDGTDLSPLLLGTGRDTREEVLLGLYSSSAEYFQTGTWVPEWRGVRTKQYTYCKWLAGSEELYDNLADPYQMANLAADGATPEVLLRLRARLSDLLAAAHDDFRPGSGYAAWFDERRNLVETALGPVPT